MRGPSSERKDSAPPWRRTSRSATELSYLLLNRCAAQAQGFLERIELVLAELPLVLSTPALIEAACRDDYGRSEDYDTQLQQARGLYPFEQRAMKRFFPKPPARILVHGVGGGRQLLALLSAGYEVEAHEPAAGLAKAAARLAREHGHPAVRVGTDSIQEWAASGATTLADAILLGWSTYSHLLSQADRLAALRAFHAACPRGPALVSFYRSFDWDTAEESERRTDLHPRREGRLLRTLHHQIREKWLRLPPIERGTTWHGRHSGNFFHAVEPWELAEEAGASGYDVAYFERDPAVYPHAVLVPREQQSR